MTSWEVLVLHPSISFYPAHDPFLCCPFQLRVRSRSPTPLDDQSARQGNSQSPRYLGDSKCVGPSLARKETAFRTALSASRLAPPSSAQIPSPSRAQGPSFFPFSFYASLSLSLSLSLWRFPDGRRSGGIGIGDGGPKSTGRPRPRSSPTLVVRSSGVRRFPEPPTPLPTVRGQQ